MVNEPRKLPEMADVTTDQQNNGVSVHLDMDRATASRLNITPDQIDSTLYDAFGQRQISTLYTQSNQYHVILETLPEFQQNADKLKAIYIQGANSSGGAAQSTSGRTSAASNGTVSTLSPSSSSGVASSTPTSSITNTPGNQTSSTSSTTSSSDYRQHQPGVLDACHGDHLNPPPPATRAVAAGRPAPQAPRHRPPTPFLFPQLAASPPRHPR